MTRKLSKNAIAKLFLSLTFGNLRLSAKRLEAIVPQTRELLMSTKYSADELFAADLSRRMQLGLDWGALYGTGGEFQPTGIANTPGVEKIDAKKMDAQYAADGKLTADFPVYVKSLVMSKNVDDQALGWAFNSFMEGYLKNILGNVYNVTDAFTTTANFVEGAGNKYPKGTNVVVVKVGDAYKYDVLAGFVDLSGYVEKEAGKGLSDENFTAALKDKLDGIAAGANKYVHPTHTAAASGLYKTTVDEEGHVTATTPVTKDDITKLGIPAQDTTYDEATTAKAGLMSAADKTKLDGMGATINKAIADHTATDAEVSEMLAEVYGE